MKRLGVVLAVFMILPAILGAKIVKVDFIQFDMPSSWSGGKSGAQYVWNLKNAPKNTANSIYLAVLNDKNYAKTQLASKLKTLVDKTVIAFKIVKKEDIHPFEIPSKLDSVATAYVIQDKKTQVKYYTFYAGILASGDIYYFSYITSDAELYKKFMKGDMQSIFNSLTPSESGDEDIEGNP